jgi:hypothetical protein
LKKEKSMKTYEIEVWKEVTEVWTVCAENEEDAKANYTDGHEKISETESIDFKRIQEVNDE